MVTKVLVANRSEIACRIFQACREMGLQRVAIYAPGDEEARHLTYADEVYKVPSYLDISAILEVVKKSKVKLVHPGYGFLSERAEFVEAIEKIGTVFIGPRSETMRQMGDKIFAKELAQKLKVPTLPWTKIKVGESLKEAAKKIGFPLLVKAAAGGGGKGMRVVKNSSELELALETASKEAQAFFGDGTLFLEKFIAEPRHIEIQVFGDGKGGGVHLFERECTLQRRHQKIWEESPAPHLSQKTKIKLQEAALRLVKNVKYQSAGTVEFLVDEKENFYFLEMNTRLQVEHPVTEQVTGVDLVQAQLSLALNPKEFPFAQKDLQPRGHAIEVRLYAEDPFHGFIPTPGKIAFLKWPTGAGIRIDSGIEEGQNIGSQYDSLLAKLIVSAENREKAIERLKYALEETVILGVGSNQSYLRALCDHPQVKNGKVSTHFLEKTQISLGKEGEAFDLSRFVQSKESLYASPWMEHRIEKAPVLRPGGWCVLEGKPRRRFIVREYKNEWSYSLDGILHHEKKRSLAQHSLHQDFNDTAEIDLNAHFPGKVRKILVQVGDEVNLGDALLLVEAMKMEFAIKAPYRAKVLNLLVQEGQQLSVGDRYLDLERIS